MRVLNILTFSRAKWTAVLFYTKRLCLHNYIYIRKSSRKMLERLYFSNTEIVLRIIP